MVVSIVFCSKVLRKEKPISTPGDLNKQEWATINKDLTVSQPFQRENRLYTS